MLNSYTGYMWWDEETDGELMYPKEQKYPTAEEFTLANMSNPDETAARGNWSDPAFLAHVAELNPQARHTQFADFHGHGWVFRAVYKKDRHGKLLDHRGEPVASDSTAALMAAVALPEELKERYRTKNAAAAQQAAFDRAESKSRRTCPCTSSIFTWKRECTASTVISSRTPTATPSSTARFAPPSRSSASTATARPASVPLS